MYDNKYLMFQQKGSEIDKLSENMKPKMEESNKKKRINEK